MEEPGKFKAKDIMKTDFVSVSKEDNLMSVSRKMINGKTSEALIIEDKKVIGIITLRDIVKCVGMGISGKARVDGVMTKDLIVSGEEDYLIDILKKMRDNEISRMPIVNKDNEIVGIINERRLIEVMPSILEILYEKEDASPSDSSYEDKRYEGFCEVCGNYSDSLRYVDGKLICEQCYEEEYNG